MPFKKRTDCEQRAKARVWWGGRERKRSTHVYGNRLAAQVMTSKGSLTSARQISITATPLAPRDMEATSFSLFKFLELS